MGQTRRKPLVGEFTFRGATVFVIANHFASKGGDDPLFGRWQQPVRASEVQRVKQATEVRGFIDSILDVDASARVVVLGDINDFEFSPSVDTLVGAQQPPARRMVDLPRTLPAAERYSYVYEGNSQVLDHILLSSASRRRLPGSRSRPTTTTSCTPTPSSTTRTPTTTRRWCDWRSAPARADRRQPVLRGADGAHRAGTIARRALLCPP